eukprot:UN09572
MALLLNNLRQIRKRLLYGIYNLNRRNGLAIDFCTSTQSVQTIESKIRNKLESELEPTELHIFDTSCGCGQCGASFGIEIKSAHFNGKKTLQQHKLVNRILKEEIANIHGISLKTDPT